MAKAGQASYQRWNLQHRLQHGFLVISMIGLLTSGLAIKFHYVSWAQWMFRFLGGFRNNLLVHKASAALLVLVSAWHLGYLLMNYFRDRSQKWEMVPSWRDARDVYHHGLYLLNLRKDPPQFDRYSYLEKFEYLAIFWGMVIMGITGFSLWFPAVAGQFMPRWWLDALRIVHGNEAVVAVITLAYGHFFTAHFHPAVFPSNPVWLTGKISLEHLMHEHPAEYQRLMEQGRISAMTSGDHEHPLPTWRRVLAGVELIIYSAVFYYLLIAFIPQLLA